MRHYITFAPEDDSSWALSYDIMPTVSVIHGMDESPQDALGSFSEYGAVFAVSDYYAVELMYFLIENGYRIPDDIWIIGFDGLSLGKNAKPELASVSQNVMVRAEKAVRYIKKMKADKDYSVTEIIPVSFIPGKSCGYISEENA